MAEEKDGAQAQAQARFLPDDVIIEILYLAPAKSLLRFKCVCKTWYDLIQSPNFIKNRFHPSDKHNRLLAIHDPNYITKRLNRCFTSFLVDSPSIRQNIDNPLITSGLNKSIKKILGPVHGLYFIHYSYATGNEDFIALWNPSTSEFRTPNLPDFESPEYEPRLPCDDGLALFQYDFGFGSVDDEIKLVCIRPFPPFVAAMYNLARDCWRKINCSVALIYTFAWTIRGYAYSNGAYYWLVKHRDYYEDEDEDDDEEGYKDGYHVLVFDMRTEVFREVRIPHHNLLYTFRDCKKYKHSERILVRNNSIVLCISQFSRIDDVDCVDIWEIKEEGWNKVFSFVPPFSYSAPLQFWKEDEVLFRANDWKLVLHNIHSNETRNLGIEARIGVLDYEESFTSVKGGKLMN